MASFIIYEAEKYMRYLYTNVVKKLLYTAKDSYDIYEFEKYSLDTEIALTKIAGPKIYILDINVPGKNGLDLARKIRDEGDVTSPIIIITSHDNLCIPKFTKNTLCLNVISKEDDVVEELWDSLKYAYKIITSSKVLTFSSYDEVHRIPYDEIYYIEKNLNDDFVTINTKEGSFQYLSTILNMKKMLESDARFFKSNRSTIINLYKVTNYDKVNNILTLDAETELCCVCRSKKKIMVERLYPIDLTNV